MKDFERIDAIEREIGYLHHKFALIFAHLDGNAKLTDAVLKCSQDVIAQNERLIKDLEKELRRRN